MTAPGAHRAGHQRFFSALADNALLMAGAPAQTPAPSNTRNSQTGVGLFPGPHLPGAWPDTL